MTEGENAAVLLSQGTVAEPSNGRRSWCPTDGVINGCHGFTVQTWASCKLGESCIIPGKTACRYSSYHLTLFFQDSVSCLCCLQ